LCQRGPEHDARPLGERLQASGAILDDLGHVDRGEIELELAGLDLGDVEEVGEERQRVEPALMNVLDIALVRLFRSGRSAPSMSSAKPMIELRGVRTSWLTLARKSTRPVAASAPSLGVSSGAGVGSADDGEGSVSSSDCLVDQRNSSRSSASEGSR
jgi:hypothetical protein